MVHSLIFVDLRGYLRPKFRSNYTFTDEARVTFLNENLAIFLYYSRLKPFQLMAYLDPYGRADGELFWDDGDSINSYQKSKFTHVKFFCDEAAGVFSSELQHTGYMPKGSEMRVSELTIVGVKRKVTEVTVDGVKRDFEYDDKVKVRFTIYDLFVRVAINPLFCRF